MTAIFGAQYAGAYDAIYRTKDYEREVDLIERLLAEEGRTGRLRILDLGCGTGNHAIPLAGRGHVVMGVDQSSSMLARARAKAAESLAPRQRPAFELGDVRSFDIGTTFDAVIMMFAVLGYLPADEDIRAALRNVRRHLAPAGIFIFDVWYGPAVLADRPGDRRLAVDDGGSKIVRHTTSEVDLERDLCTVTFDLSRSSGADETTIRESHTMRYFFPESLKALFGDCGLRLLTLADFRDGTRPADETTWNVIGLGVAA